LFERGQRRRYTVFRHSIRDHKTLRRTPAEPAALIESTATV